MAHYVRTVDDVKLVVNHAKLEESEINPLTQVIYFPGDNRNFRLMELNNDVEQAFKEGQKVYFRGGKDDKAVLCTSDKTFDIKEAETSNSLLLIPSLRFPEHLKNTKEERFIEEKHIIGVYHDYLELKRMQPRLKRLRSLLMEKPYKGVELEEENQTQGYYSTDDLLNLVQSSEAELLEALLEIEAFVVNGKWRLMDPDYHFRALSFLLNLVEENSWSISEIPIGETIITLKELLPDQVLNQIIQLYLKSTGSSTDDGEELYELDSYKVCRFLGISLLRPVEKFNYQDFLQAWQQSVPEGMRTKIEQLDGAALRKLDSKPQVIWYYPEEDLSEDLHERFNQLFQVKDVWALEEISPYIKKLATEKQSVNALLTKFARASNYKGKKYYCARHGK